MSSLPDEEEQEVPPPRAFHPSAELRLRHRDSLRKQVEAKLVTPSSPLRQSIDSDRNMHRAFIAQPLPGGGNANFYQAEQSAEWSTEIGALRRLLNAGAKSLVSQTPQYAQTNNSSSIAADAIEARQQARSSRGVSMSRVVAGIAILATVINVMVRFSGTTVAEHVPSPAVAVMPTAELAPRRERYDHLVPSIELPESPPVESPLTPRRTRR